jgi:DNA-binding beta-propeller fold protein YncE
MMARSILFSVLLLVGAAAVSCADVYVANTEGPSITVYATTAVGDTPPIRTISGPHTGLNWPLSVTVDLTNGELYVADFFGEAIRVFALMANGDVAPLRTLINGTNSHLGQPRMVALDLVRNEIYVVSINGAIRVFPRTASGDASPSRTIEGPQTRLDNPLTIALDLVHNEILVDSYSAGGDDVPGIVVFARTASGDASPLRTIAGPLTQFGTFANIVDLDLTRNEIFAQGDDGAGVLVFPRTASGNVAPIRNLTGPSTGLDWITGLLVDEPNSRIILTQGESNEILVFDRLATGDTRPLMRVLGPSTGLDAPWGLAVDGSGGFTATMDVEDDGAARPPILVLGANPWMDETPITINFWVTRGGPATAGIFEPSGRRVATILNHELGEGRHTVSWDRASCSVPSGVYFIRVTQGDDQVVRKLVIR